jgi:kinetochore protein NDC80
MDRRKTLAGLPPNTINSRQSLAPGRILKDAKAAGAWVEGNATKVPMDRGLARMSLAGPVQRRGSAYTTVKAPPGLKNDPRPLSDKAYQGNCIRTIISFLATHNYEYQITPKVGFDFQDGIYSDFSELLILCSKLGS